MCGRILSIAIRKDADIKKIVKSIKGIRCNNANDETPACPDKICEALIKFLDSKDAEAEKDKENA